MRNFKSIKRWLTMTLLAWFLSFNVNAASILIDAGNITALVSFTYGQFEGGFSINGSTPTSGGSFVFGNSTQLNFTGQWIDLGQATAFTRTVYWQDPNAPSIVEQIFQWTVTPSGASGLATISGFFEADPFPSAPLPPGIPVGDLIVLQADGSHNPFQFSASFLTGQVIADTPASVPPIPVPAAVWLFGTALVGFLGLSRRKKTT